MCKKIVLLFLFPIIVFASGNNDITILDSIQITRLNTPYDKYFVNILEYYRTVDPGTGADPAADWDWSITFNKLKNDYNGRYGSTPLDTILQRGLVIYFPAGLYNFNQGNVELFNTSNGVNTFHSLSIVGPAQSMHYAEGDKGGAVLNCTFTNEPLFLVDLKSDLSTVPDHRAVRFSNLQIEASSSTNGITGIKGYHARRSVIENCSFNDIDYAINFASTVTVGSEIGKSYSDGLVISNVNIQKSLIGIQIAGGDITKISSVDINNRLKPNSLYGIFINGGTGLFLDNIIINGLEDNTGAAIYLKRCHSAKLSGMHFETNQGDIYRLSDTCSGISIDGSSVSFSYKRLINAENAVNCELKNHRNICMDVNSIPSGSNSNDCDIYLNNSQFSISNLYGNVGQYNGATKEWTIIDDYSYNYFTSSANDPGMIANFLQNNHFLNNDFPFLLLRDANKQIFKVDNNGNQTISGTDFPSLTLQSDNMNGGLINLKSNNTNLVQVLNYNGEYRVNVGSNLGQVIKTDGNVGIGTASPSEKLEVDGNIKVNGEIIADYIVVGGRRFEFDGDCNCLKRKLAE